MSSSIEKLGQFVTKESVDIFVNELMIQTGKVKPFLIDGIPEGFSFWMDDEKKIPGLRYFARLLGFTPGHVWTGELGAAFMKPVMVDDDATEVEETEEIEKRKKEMVGLYNQNIKHVK